MKNILFLAANPKGTSPLRLDQEFREIGEELRRAHQDHQFHLDQRLAVRPRDIQQAMLDINPQIVHFSGHGQGTKLVFPPQETSYRSSATLERKATPVSESLEPVDEPEPVDEEGLVFEDDQGQAKLVSGAALAGLFELFTDEVECVLLNGCYSATQAMVISQHVPYVIGMSDAISDKAAIEFAIGFYKALGAGRGIEFAYRMGCNAIQMHGIPEHLTPVLISKSNASPAPRLPQTKLSSPPEFPSGPVGLESQFYIERLPNETRHYRSIRNPGCLLRIMAPDLMGKTSLMARILHSATEQNYHTIYLNLRDAEQRVLVDLNSFLYWLIERIIAELGLKNQLNEHWDDKTMGCISNCTHYFEKFILRKLEQPIVLGVDEVDRIFPYSDIATDFFGMLRNWFEKGRTQADWKALRLVLAYSTEDYSQFRINQSPFNVGEPLRLRELTRQQVQELGNRYGLSWADQQIDSLMAMVGGHPYLVRLAMYYISDQEVTLEQLLQEAPTEDGIYSDHLHRYWKTLSSNAQLAETIQIVMSAKEPVAVERSLGYQLRSMGLVQYEGNSIRPSCSLYRLYFRK
ncbi:AAA-like domain-containing protein [Leptolyngbya ohadii]|uniref:AAA-like domain-containing protein n=1 Tax=Leptolyngbya ohadii TaxID=1962290 RepID=UPI000B59B09F|nr:AAA-like domain-containing protein [Leptolyngbya ohadii]